MYREPSSAPRKSSYSPARELARARPSAPAIPFDGHEGLRLEGERALRDLRDGRAPLGRAARRFAAALRAFVRQKRGAPHKNMRVFAVSMTPPELLARDGLDIRDASCRINSNFLISSRTYWYVVPTFVFAKRDHGDLSRKESVIAFMNSM